ncbi:16S rRNA (cytosine(1402)-N(4))-methyltransferase RsmH [Stappia sp.]|uniref:16S rRNA (cytosine(1402)-N(4))-methyltransferase RsmH n=1 Tax=Stappia sp. TaxID=1870903 RepID=UPI0035B50C95
MTAAPQTPREATSHVSDAPAEAAPHIPVMLDEVLEALAPAPGETVVDGTFGAGGYSRAILARGARVVAIDRDPDAIAAGQALARDSDGRLTLVQGRFSDLDRHCAELGLAGVAGVVLDLGVSSMQLDRAERGFSFRHDGPLDMRMERAGPSAADVVNTTAQKDLTRIIGLLGEEKRASAVSRAICERRTQAPFTRTADLAAVVEKVVGRPPRGAKIHPATRTFQALRIHVNGELDQVATALGAAERALAPGGRLVVVTFHSLEDRIVKRFLADRSRRHAGGSRHLPETDVPPATFDMLVKGARAASDAEAARNPRARSAKLRAAVRTQGPARDLDPASLGLPRLAALVDAEERS